MRSRNVQSASASARRRFAAGLSAAVLIGSGALVAGASAGASTPVPAVKTPGFLDCVVSGLITFAPPGLSHLGSSSSRPVSKADTSASLSQAGCTSTPIVEHLDSTSTTPCTAADVPAPRCQPGRYVYDTAQGFATAAPALLLEHAKGIRLTDGTKALKLEVTSVVPLLGQDCGPELGYKFSGHAARPTSTTFTMTYCLGADSGANTSGVFFHDFGLALSGTAAAPPQIATATIDPTYSRLVIN